ncbi:hypothetical protein NRB56_53430 [Nocardia sp. RB56]|uniref:NadR/Ttd14 AAA domain-containing protein n=2 Tax=Nocardia aurantia TaxID=2585199 RepID=A0A7K0DVE1_9NOCA|nr:hypothetical protein [Nocardia aurantia]
MKDSPELRLAVTGASPDGKYTVTTALSLATGVPRISVPSESIAPSTERRLGDTVETPIRAFEARVDSEARAGTAFISDGSVLHEWAAAESLRRGRHRREWLWHPGSFPFRKFEESFLAAHASIVRRHACVAYDAVVHLRPEPAETDGDYAASQLTDRILVDALYPLPIPFLIVGGPAERILARITNLFALPLRMPLSEALSTASQSEALSTASDETWQDDFPTQQFSMKETA